MSSVDKRIAREERTIRLMIGIYCSHNHSTDRHLCNECLELWNYAHSRLLKCPFAPDKPACAKCPIHCYKPVMRERIRQVMRFSGPRMLWLYPILTFQHLLDNRIEARRKEKD